MPKIRVALGSPDLKVCTIAVLNYTGDSVSVKYVGLPGNQPKTNGNFVAIWESSMIPWQGAPPLKRVDIQKDVESGSITIDNLTIKQSSYVVGYGVGPAIKDICASALIQAGGLLAAPMSVQIGLNYVGTDSVSVNYKTLYGYRPHTLGNWVGLWKGYVSPYYAPDMLGHANIPSDSSEGNVGINDVDIGVKSSYTLIYFMGDKLTEAAAILTFDTSE